MGRRIMEIRTSTTVSPPQDETEYDIRIIDYGQGDPKLDILPAGEQPGYTFRITNEQLYECEWRDEETPLPTPVLRAAEYYGYHVTDVTQRPKHGLYENVRYLKDAAHSIRDSLHPEDTVSHAGVEWMTDSLDSLEKLELLRAHLSPVEYDMVLLKAYETSRGHSSGNLTIPTTEGQTSASLNSIVVLMLAYAQHDGYLGFEILDSDTVDSLVEEPNL